MSKKKQAADQPNLVTARKRKRINADAKTYYVYALVDPRCDEVFYIGKGLGRRAWQHMRRCALKASPKGKKSKRIAEIQRDGLSVVVEMIAEGLAEVAAYSREREEIAKRRATLTNGSGGGETELERCWRQINELLARSKSKTQWARDWMRQHQRKLTDEDYAIYDDVLRGHLEVRAWIKGKMIEQGLLQ